jgi:hypothetical protein
MGPQDEEYSEMAVDEGECLEEINPQDNYQMFIDQQFDNNNK